MSAQVRLEQSEKQAQKLSPQIIRSIKLLELPAQALFNQLQQTAADNVFINPDAPGLCVLHNTLQGDNASFRQWLENQPDTTQDDFTQYLKDQILALPLHARLHWACNKIIDALDERGLLSKEDLTCLELPPPLGEQALSIVQRLNPPGVAQNDVPHCLLAQIPPDHPRRKRMIRLISRHYDRLVKGRYAEIRRSMGLNNDDYSELITYLGQLHPYPSSGFAQKSNGCTPLYDLLFTDIGQGILAVDVAGEQLMREGIVDKTWDALLVKNSHNPLPREEISKLARQREEALRLQEALQMRHKSLRSLGAYLAKTQRDFLMQGYSKLAPLTMQDAADDLGLSVSAISRLVKEKYGFAPCGTFTLRSLFCANTVKDKVGNTSLSAIALEKAISDIVSQEDSVYPFNDDELSQMLKTRGIFVARRTVAKHRAAAGIPPQAKRRKPKIKPTN